MDFVTKNPIVFVAFSKRNFFWRDHIVKYVLESGKVPVCAFVMFDYFLADTLPRDVLIDANNDLIRRSDELWVFGEVSNGVKMEIDLAKSLQKPVRFFAINPNVQEIKQIKESEVQFDYTTG